MPHTYIRTHLPRLVKTSGVLLVISLAMVLLPRYFASGTSAAGPCDVPAAQIGFDTEEANMLQLINTYRAQNGIGPLQISYTLSKSAQWKSTDMAVNNYYDHVDIPINRDPYVRFADCGYGYNVWRGENIDIAYQTANAAFGAWQGSSSHNAAMLDPDFHAIGIGRASQANGWWYWTADFGGYADGATFTPPLPNDDFTGATNITDLPYATGPFSTLSTTAVTRELGEPTPCCQLYFGSMQPCYLWGTTVWYKFTAAQDMTVQADTLGSDYNTVVGVYTGPSLDALTPVACNDNYGGVQSLVQVPLTAGTTYYFQVGNLFASQSDPDTMQPYPTDLVFELTCLSTSCPAGAPAASPSPTATSTTVPATPTSTGTQAAPSPTPTTGATVGPTPSPTPGPAPAPAIDPVVDPPITQPTDGAIVPAGKTITIAATANGANGIAKVEFYVNGVRKCSDSTSPYTCNWGVPTAKGVVYTLTAKAYDPQGNTASESITVTSGHDSIPPTVGLTAPASGDTVAPGAIVSIAATAADEVGVAKVEFYVNGVRKCSDKLASYVCNWTVPSGTGVTYTLVARAYDAQGNATYSPAVTVTSR